MHQDFLQKFFLSDVNDDVVFFYYGSFSESIISALAENIRKSLLKPISINKQLSKKMFSSFVELTMNILHHASLHDSPAYGVVVMGHENGRYFIATGNKMYAKHTSRLKERMDIVIKMSNEELHDAYWSQLRNNDNEESDPLSRGAGLGFLTLAQNVSEPISYFFHEVPDHPDQSVFFLKLFFK